MNIKLVPFSLFLVPYSLFLLIPYLGDQCLSLDIGFKTIVLFISTMIQNDRIHISAKIVKNLYNQMSQFTNIEQGENVLFSLFLVPFPYSFYYCITYYNNNTK